MVNYVHNSYFLLFIDLYNINDFICAVKIRKAQNFLFILIYSSMKYSLAIQYIEEEISGQMTEIKIYSENKTRISLCKQFSNKY